MFQEKVNSIWGYVDKSTENAYITKLLKLLLEYNYVWSPEDRTSLRINLCPNEKVKLLREFNQLQEDDFDELQVSAAISDIKDAYNEERQLIVSKTKDKSELPWFSLAHQLFRDRVGRDISVQDFKKSELVSFYNNLIEPDLLLISNRNLHLQAVLKEFIKFARFVTRPSNKKHFHVFLIPVFQHLYLLVRSHCGKSDAERFIRYTKYLHLPPDVIDNLSQHETCEDLQLHINSHARIRVKLSSCAYNILMNWLRDCFTEFSEMFNILRVLHENFLVDIYHDKDDEDFLAVEGEVLQDIQKWYDEFAQETQKKSEADVSSEACETPQSDDDRMTQNMSETPEMPGTPIPPESNDELMTQNMSDTESEMPGTSIPEMPGTSIPPESNGSESNFELKSSMFKLREQARRYLEKVRNSGWDLDKIEEALLNPPDFSVADSSDDLMTQNMSEMDAETSEMPVSPISPKSNDDLMSQNISNIEAEMPENPTTPENNDDLMFQNIYISNIDAEMPENPTTPENNADVEDMKNEEHQEETKHHYFKFNQTYATDFHSAYPLTISGKDVLCSSDVSPDFLYLACGFESCKISTWRLCCDVLTLECKNDFELQPIGTLRGHKGIVYALSIDSNRKTLISGSHDRTVMIWDIEESTCLSTINAHSAPVYAVCVSPNSRYFLSASEDKVVALFWYDEVYPVRVYNGHSRDAINCVRFHPNCTYFASASSDGNVFLFKINDDRCPVRMFRKHRSKVYTLAFSPCGKHLASADVDGILVIWDILTCVPIKTLETGQGIRSISYDISGSFLAALFFYESWKVYGVEEKITTVIKAESNCVPKSVHFSTGNKMLIIQYLDKSEISKTNEKPKTEIKMFG